MAWLKRTDKLISEWKSLQPISTEAKKLLDKKFRLEFNYNSNHLEGNTLTYGETELLLLFDDTHGSHSMREYEEMKAHDVAWHLVEEWAQDKNHPLTEQAIKNLNEIILVRPFWKDAITSDGQSTRRQIKIGDYKQYPNSVRLANGEIFEYSSPIDTPILMRELVEWLNTEQLHPVTLAAMLHYKFVRIHPFDDGNGRIARLLMNYVFLKNDLPPVIIKSADKQNYLRSLHLADTGDFESFIAYIGEQLQWSLDIAIKAAKGESVEEGDDWQKRLHLIKKKTRTPDQVTLKKSLESYKAALNNIIIPLVESWENNLKKAEPLFNRKLCTLKLNEKEPKFSDSDLMKVVHRCFNEEGIPRTLKNYKELHSIELAAQFFDLRTSNLNAGFNAGELRMNFEENAIAITTVTNQRISKLYSETLTQAEIKSITDDLSNWFTNHLEEFIHGNPDA
jgi:Fic family protein